MTNVTIFAGVSIDRNKITNLAFSQILPLVLSPTCYYANFRKHTDGGKIIHLDQRKHLVGNLIRRYNKRYLLISIFVAILVCICDPSRELYSAFPTAYWVIVFFVFWSFTFSRANEIFFAFSRDAVDKVKGNPSSSDLQFSERISLALRSYLELIINFATMYYMLPSTWFDHKFDSYLEAIYFSGITITTLGYGDIAPEHAIPQLLSVYEVLCGFILLIVSFTIYTGRGITRLNG